MTSHGHTHHWKTGRRSVPYIWNHAQHRGMHENWYSSQLGWPLWAPGLKWASAEKPHLALYNVKAKKFLALQFLQYFAFLLSIY